MRDTRFAKQKSLGPGFLVAAAFIGPGTVTVASKAGHLYGFELLWTILLAVATTIILQDLVSRISIVTQSGLAEVLRNQFTNQFARFALLGLVMLGILFGNSAYQTGNLLGAAKGIEIFAGNETINQTWAVLVIGIVSIGLVCFGSFNMLKWSLTILVAVMGGLFVVAAIMIQPAWTDLAAGLIPKMPTGDSNLSVILTIVGLVATTVVPYNLFLHASATADQYVAIDEPVNQVDSSDQLEKNSENQSPAASISDSRLTVFQTFRSSMIDTIISVGFGGFVTASILITAAVAGNSAQSVDGKFQLTMVSAQLQPLLGDWSKVVVGVGLFAAGLTSSLTAPLAAAMASAGCLGWKRDFSTAKFRAIAVAVIIFGMICAVQFGAAPAQTILLAQVANAILLPLLAVLIVYLVNNQSVMGEHTNGKIRNLLSIAATTVVFLLVARQLYNLF